MSLSTKIMSIKDDYSIIQELLRESLQRVFLEEFEDEDLEISDAMLLRSALYEWMLTRNAFPLMMMIDNDDCITEFVEEELERLGKKLSELKCPWEREKHSFDEFIKQTLHKLPYLPDAKYLFLDQLFEILTDVEMKGCDDRNYALTAIQQWIQVNCQFQNVMDQKHIADFYQMNREFKKLVKKDELVKRASVPLHLNRYQPLQIVSKKPVSTDAYKPFRVYFQSFRIEESQKTQETPQLK